MKRFPRVFALFLFGAILVALSGCAKEDEADSSAPIESSLNYSLAEPIDLAELKTRKEYDEFCKSCEIAVVKFGAEWCGPCQKLTPELRKMAGYYETQDAKFADVDVDDPEMDALANELGIKAIPNVFVFYRGSLYSNIVGYNPGSLASLIDSICQTEAAPTEPGDWTDEAVARSESEERGAESPAPEPTE
ncbi:MAG: thioredoxin family protein [Thermoguttaceae bacterium]|nr:thioredoxin family protein [Thermoguttaceae bacterium]